MSEYLLKSEKNKEAVILLLNHNNPAPSITCSYYRCVQKMLHIIHHKIGMTKEEFIAKSKIPNSEKQKGTHKVAIDIISSELAKNKYSDDGAWKYFQEKIKFLKRAREESDYHEKKIGKEEAQGAQAWSDAIDNILVKQFKL